MRSRPTVAAVTILLIAQAFGSFSFIARHAAAQGNEEVILIVGEKSKDVCRVQYRKSDDGNWGSDTIEGPAEACQGGLVTAYVTTSAEASNVVAAARADTSESTEVRTVPLTGNDANDEAAALAEISAIHQSFAPEIDEDGGDESLTPGTTLGFMAPGDPDESTQATSATCVAGHVGQQRRTDTTWRQKGIMVDVEARVIYKRISCSRWLISNVRVTYHDPYSYRIWLRDLEYTKAWYPGSGVYAHRASDPPICEVLSQDSWLRYSPLWEIKAKGYVQIESIDTNPNHPSTLWSCAGGAGTSATSAWVELRGGTR